MLKLIEGVSGLSELSVISWVSAVEGCPLSGVPLYTQTKDYISYKNLACIYHDPLSTFAG